MMQEIPRLSPTIAKHLLAAPSIAYTRHRLLGGVDSETTADMHAGSLLERLITGHEVDKIELIDAPDWRTKDARAARDAATSEGLLPVLRHVYEGFAEAGDIIKAKLTARVEDWFSFEPQIRFEWESSGCHCSGVLDLLNVEHDRYTIIDLKKTQSAHPADIGRSVIRYGYDIQHAAYMDAVEHHHPNLRGRGRFYFAFFEANPPYCVTIAELDGGLKTLGKSKWEKAKRVWAKCLESGVWPDYSTEIVRIEAKPYDLEAIEDTSDDELDALFSNN